MYVLCKTYDVMFEHAQCALSECSKSVRSRIEFWLKSSAWGIGGSVSV